MNMSQKDYIEQVERENELLKQKLDDALRKYDELYMIVTISGKEYEKLMLKEITGSVDVPVGVPTKYKIRQEALDDIRKMHGLDVGKFMKEYIQKTEDESYDV